MVAGSWTLEDGQTWWQLRGRDQVTAYLVVLWVLTRVVVALLPAVTLCDRTATCVPSPGAAWWSVLLWASILLVRLWPLAATLCAFVFAFADAWWARASGWPGMWGPILELAYALGCAAHLLYFERARNRQRCFAAEHAAKTVPALATGTFYRWRVFPFVACAIPGAILFTLPAFFFSFTIGSFAPERTVLTATWSTIAGCGFLLGVLVCWRYLRRRLQSVHDGGPAIPVEACRGLGADVYIYARGVDQAFTRFSGGPMPNATPREAVAGEEAGPFHVEVGDVLTGYLYGDLRTGGFAAFTSDDGGFLPASALKRPASAESTPRRIRDTPPSEATAEARYIRGIFNKVTTKIVITPDALTRTRSSPRGPTTVEIIPMDRVVHVELMTFGNNDRLYLQIMSYEDNYTIPRSSYKDDFPFVLGERLRQSNGLNKVRDDATRVHLGLVGQRGKTQEQRPTSTSIDTPHVSDRQPLDD